MSQNVSHFPNDARAQLTDAERHRLLGNQRRQRLLDELDELPSPVDVDTMAETLATNYSEYDADDQETIRRLTISLHHQHLPMMDSLGVISYDPSSKQIEV